MNSENNQPEKPPVPEPKRVDSSAIKKWMCERVTFTVPKAWLVAGGAIFLLLLIFALD